MIKTDRSLEKKYNFISLDVKDLKQVLEIMNQGNNVEIRSGRHTLDTLDELNQLYADTNIVPHLSFRINGAVVVGFYYNSGPCYLEIGDEENNAEYVIFNRINEFLETKTNKILEFLYNETYKVFMRLFFIVSGVFASLILFNRTFTRYSNIYYVFCGVIIIYFIYMANSNKGIIYLMKKSFWAKEYLVKEKYNLLTGLIVATLSGLLGAALTKYFCK
ncbi:MAG TPA: hypothetical protein DEE98_03265 [Elusimicrobia bacterium]|nr:MAG: hypothetical protein A2278_08080 [Elusimicrobia bacterium RIFOXYA12_FULL_49_49]OGS09941.1 MAG: hypothetical protein A2204_02585 [Elusimicrobia bacterium RIFOXYA1_FULL_47_7]OGS11275.1 MAG: hypothetical protein A2386_02090 [Elusimicrobia bacterium RIFOXYB1_FULL_48_9]OGS15978.1 MAG: hypothetical protein A2251_02185 [Elusimicrobia bacterium RIFOXYA2_FULL_47_53]OGS26342.1 MAG: hypothetical protein A2339_03080 [Elusimicrobia bacterium RIFOXYB12_FULL_50_12]OGS29146.1 MAG: hypothetical protein